MMIYTVTRLVERGLYQGVADPNYLEVYASKKDAQAFADKKNASKTTNFVYRVSGKKVKGEA